jgi:hypothetical protein
MLIPQSESLDLYESEDHFLAESRLKQIAVGWPDEVQR